MGVAFRNIQFVCGLAPAVTLQGAAGMDLKVNLGETPFQFQPPDSEYQSVQQWIVEHRPMLAAPSAAALASIPPPSAMLRRGVSTVRTLAPVSAR